MELNIDTEFNHDGNDYKTLFKDREANLRVEKDLKRVKQEIPGRKPSKAVEDILPELSREAELVLIAVAFRAVGGGF